MQTHDGNGGRPRTTARKRGDAVKLRLEAWNWRTGGFALAVGVSVFCVISTYISCHFAGRSHGLFPSLVNFFTLTNENNFGAWWSSTMLFMASLLAFEGFLRAPGGLERARTAYPWLAVSAISLVLSIDEGASIHERIGAWTGWGMWEASAPFGLVLSLMIAFAAYGLWRDPGRRASSVWLMISMALFGTVALQEHLEFQAPWWGTFAALRAVLEEGTEIIGMLILLRVAMAGSLAQRRESGADETPTFQFLGRYERPLLWAPLLLAPFIAHLSARLPDQQRGRPAAWAAAMIFSMAALVACNMTQRAKHPVVRPAILAILLGALSVQAFVLSSEVGRVVSKRLLVFGLTFSLLLAIQFSASVRTTRPAKVIVTALAGILLLLPFANASLFVQNVVVLIAGLGAWHLVASVPHQDPVWSKNTNNAQAAHERADLGASRPGFAR